MKRRWLLVGSVLSVAGCSVLPQQEYRQRRDWSLAPSRGSVVKPRANAKSLLVRTVSAAPGLEARGVQWLLKDGSVNTDYWEQWIVPPALSVEESLRRWLSDSGVFAAVVAPGSRAVTDLVLEAELTALIADPNKGTAKASLSIVVLEPKGDKTKVWLQKTETAEVPLSGSAATEIVAALRDAVAKLLAVVETDMAIVAR